jgi:hypothetical protein
MSGILEANWHGVKAGRWKTEIDVIKRTFHEFNTAATVGPICHGV